MSNSETTEKTGNNGENSEPGTDIAASITMAFNLGVSANRQAKGTKSTAQALAEMGEHIFTNLSRTYGGKLRQEHIIANTEYLLQIALLGYIVPSICDYEENFKERLLALIESRAKRRSPGDGKAGKSGGTIITP